MSVEQPFYVNLHAFNITYSGILTLEEDTSDLAEDKNSTSASDVYDQKGASIYVVAVVLVYGMSIVMLIASHIKRRHTKVLEDKQIDKYLNEFQIIRDKQQRDNYKALKKCVIERLHWDRNMRRMTFENIQTSAYPLMIVGVPSSRLHCINKTNSNGGQIMSLYANNNHRRSSSLRCSSFKGSTRRKSARLSHSMLSLIRPADNKELKRNDTNLVQNLNTCAVSINIIPDSSPDDSSNSYISTKEKRPSRESIHSVGFSPLINSKDSPDNISSRQCSNSEADASGLQNGLKDMVHVSVSQCGSPIGSDTVALDVSSFCSSASSQDSPSSILVTNL